jgi:Zn-dependent protease with chaperone function
MPPGSTQPCPQCGASLPVVPPYLTWCHECGWNIKASPRELPAGRLDRLYEAAGRRVGQRLERELTATSELRPRPTPSKLLAYTIAGAVHLMTLALLAGGVVLIALFPARIFAVVGGALMIATGVLVRPRLGKVPDEDIVARSEAPILFGIVDQVATVVGTATADVLVVDHSYNASWAILGLRRKRVIKFGLPLLSALEPHERAALVAHELAHARNGDSSRGIFVGSAVGGLAGWYGLLAPHPTSGRLGSAEYVANVLLWLVSRPPLLLLQLEYHLLLQDSRRAEYLADAIAAQAAGSDAVVSVHEKRLLQNSFQQLVSQHAHPAAQAEGGDLFEAIRSHLAAVPERERERRRHVALLEESSLGATHPPTGRRIRLLERRPVHAAAVDVTSSQSEEVDRELNRLRPSLHRRLVELQRASLYYR